MLTLTNGLAKCFADNQAIIQDSENKLQHTVYKLYVFSQTFNSKISVKEQKIMTAKIIADNNVLKEYHFNYLRLCNHQVKRFQRF